MGLYAHFLEPCRRASQLLSLHPLPSKPRSINVPLEPARACFTLYLLFIHILDLGHDKQPKEQLQTARTWPLQQTKSIPATTLANRHEPQNHQNHHGRLHPGRWLVYVINPHSTNTRILLSSHPNSFFFLKRIKQIE